MCVFLLPRVVLKLVYRIRERHSLVINEASNLRITLCL